jgi:hypothetical protein
MRYVDTSTMTSPDQQWSDSALREIEKREALMRDIRAEIIRLETLAMSDLDNSDDIYERIYVFEDEVKHLEQMISEL